MLICVFRIWKDLSHPRVNKLWGMGREGFSPFSYISQAASSNARLSRESEGLVLTDAHLNWGGGKQGPVAKNKLLPDACQKNGLKVRDDPQLLKWFAIIFCQVVKFFP